MNLFLAKMMTFATSLPLAGEGSDGIKSDFTWITQVTDFISSLLWPILAVVAAAGSIYAIVLGVQMARADSTEKREEAKKRVMNVLIGMAIIVGLILFLQLFFKTILPAFGVKTEA